MRIDHCKQPYRNGLMDEPAPHWPRDDALVGERDQVGTDKDALEAAVSQSAGAISLYLLLTILYLFGALCKKPLYQCVSMRYFERGLCLVLQIMGMLFHCFTQHYVQSLYSWAGKPYTC
jgi:hypothetical protein